MKRFSIFILIGAIFIGSCNVAFSFGSQIGAASPFQSIFDNGRKELDNGKYVDKHGEIHEHKYQNEDIFAPWNDPLKKDDPFAPWNDTVYKNDILAPWNDPLAGERETNRYMRENNETDADYYWQ